MPARLVFLHQHRLPGPQDCGTALRASINATRQAGRDRCRKIWTSSTRPSLPFTSTIRSVVNASAPVLTAGRRPEKEDRREARPGGRKYSMRALLPSTNTILSVANTPVLTAGRRQELQSPCQQPEKDSSCGCPVGRERTTFNNRKKTAATVGPLAACGQVSTAARTLQVRLSCQPRTASSDSRRRSEVQVPDQSRVR